MKRLMALAICAGMMWGCGKKSPTQAGSTESLEVSGEGPYLHDYGWEKAATLRVPYRFNSTVPNKVCLLDSIEVSYPSDSCPGGRVTKRISYADGPDTVKAGWSSGYEGWIARSSGHDCIEWGAYPPTHGNYSVRAWGRWDGITHASNTFAWTW